MQGTHLRNYIHQAALAIYLLHYLASTSNIYPSVGWAHRATRVMWRSSMRSWLCRKSDTSWQLWLFGSADRSYWPPAAIPARPLLLLSFPSPTQPFQFACIAEPSLGWAFDWIYWCSTMWSSRLSCATQSPPCMYCAEKWTLQIDTVVALMKQNYNSATDPGQDERNEAKVTVDDVVLTTTMMT